MVAYADHEVTADSSTWTPTLPDAAGFDHLVVETPGLARGTYSRRRLQPPTLAVFGRLDHPWDEPLIRRLCGDLTTHADRVEFAFVEDAAHFLTDDAPNEVVELVLDWFERVGSA
ncbi:alpha/beta fold hydrolase [Agromyces sp. SYSU T0242]|uniref:alpha/beta fold hydrolase n=1 Tax=Agromyces litoreus TaxID=3158561 RepID=UPI00339B8336